MSTGKPSSPKPFSRILIAEVEGTARSLRHRQLQLHRLQTTLTKNRTLLIQALKTDFGYTEIEALFEYSLSLSELRAHYDSIDFEKEVQLNKTIENGVESLDRYASVGIIYVVPRSGLHAVLSPLCAAIAAGSCVIVERKIPQTTKQTSSALRSILPAGLSGDTFAVSKERPDSSFLRQCTVVLQTNEVLTTSTKAGSDLLESKKLIISPSSAKTLVVVDRTADISLAARSLIVAKFGFSNTSAYAPDVVFVHEAVAKTFSTRLVEVARSYFDGLESNTGSNKTSKGPGGSKALEGHNVLLSSKQGDIIELNQSSSASHTPSWAAGLPSTTLLLCKVTSTDEAIDLSAELGGTGHIQGPAAALIFASPADAQYIANSIDASLTCVNTFPAELLVGPKLAPSANRSGEASTALFPRYKRHLFEDSRPIVQKQTLQVLNGGTDLIVQAETKTFRQWVDSAEVPLKPTGQRPGKAVGFFDAAIMLSLATVGVPLLVGLGFVGRFAFRRYGGGKFGF
ncbi:hypothetical protein LTR84_000755 [Exophiala bonariae]|uniref:Aldehyde dehydrogenase domain-containing protein n=1 Tax=Exophiala bonariae TaxID=1690606 RepID=A0AAV9NSI7_9EURO|nr:hypothetical protein LTR84_000755 [Exophiala bonariae]